MASFDEVMVQLVKRPAQHAKFLNTLSLLEYIGARKILKSQEASTITGEILGHAAEEIRHAQTFKKLALKMSEGLLETYQDEHLLAGVGARQYIQAIDQGVAAKLKVPHAALNYLLTTLLIEERANRIYPGYDLILTECGFPSALKAIVREENTHLHDVRAALQHMDNQLIQSLDELRVFEAGLFSRFMDQVLQAIH